MMNKIFVGMLLLGIGVGAFLGNMDQVALAFVDSSKEAVQLAIVMLGVVGMWTGIMKVAEEAGIARGLARIFRPVIEFLYPSLKGKEAEKARYYIAENMAANFLGLGWAATPMGLKAMKELAVLERERLAAAERERLTEGKGKKRDGRELGSEKRNIEGKEPAVAASDEMCTFLVLNISSLQVIPVNIIAYRAQYGAVNPAAVVLPGLIATTISTLVAVIFCRLCMKKR